MHVSSIAERKRACLRRSSGMLLPPINNSTNTSTPHRERRVVNSALRNVTTANPPLPRSSTKSDASPGKSFHCGDDRLSLRPPEREGTRQRGPRSSAIQIDTHGG